MWLFCIKTCRDVDRDLMMFNPARPTSLCTITRMTLSLLRGQWQAFIVRSILLSAPIVLVRYWHSRSKNNVEGRT